MISEKDVENILRAHLDPGQYFIVKIKVSPGNKIFVAVDNYTHITLDECVKINELLVKELDNIDTDYELEVSSPGLTQPFEVIEQYKKYNGKEVEVLKRSGEKLSGYLGDTFENGFNLQVERKIKNPETKKKEVKKETIFIEFTEVKQTRRKIKF